MALCSVKVGLRGESVTLPKLRYESTTSVEQALLTRRSESQKTYREFLLCSWVGLGNST
jgi:hypothetical protein